MRLPILHTKVRGGALQYTIFISVVITLLVFAFISLTYVQSKLKLKASFFQEVIHTTNEGFKQLAQQTIPYNEETLLTFAKKNESRVLKKRWGLFDVATIQSFRNKESFTKAALLGGLQQEKPALYLQDENQPLVVVGDTKIEGRVYLPVQGAKRGSIAGHSYTGSQLIYGTVATSKKSLPKIPHLEALRSFRDELLSKENNVFIELEENTSLVNSFTNPTQIIRSNTTIDVRFVRLTGNIVIQSDTKIRVHPTATLTDVILIAPEIEILENVAGDFQAIASKQLKVAKNCNLNYPTSLVVFDERKHADNTKELNQLSIDQNTTVKGIVAFVSENSKDNYHTQLVIEDGVVIIGEVYCNQNTELKGTVKGSVYTKGFIANQFGSVYKNHVYNGKILSNELPEQYVGFSFKDSKPKTAKWLYY